LERTLRLLHPVMPFVTEEIWQRFEVGETIMRAPWPESDACQDHVELGVDAEAEWPFVSEFVSNVRRIRNQYRIAPKETLPVLFHEGPARRPVFQAVTGQFRPEVMRLAGVLDPASEPPGPQAPGFIRIGIAGETALVFVGGLIDIDTERDRVNTKLRETQERVRVVSLKLANEGFKAKAPQEIVEAEELKAERLDREMAALQEQLAELG
jgi:valyl-tRNA synthetase